jgi:hypothetical protein
MNGIPWSGNFRDWGKFLCASPFIRETMTGIPWYVNLETEVKILRYCLFKVGNILAVFPWPGNLLDQTKNIVQHCKNWKYLSSIPWRENCRDHRGR